MNKKLRRLLGRVSSKGNPISNDQRKKRKRSTLSSLLSQRPTATQNYYCRSANGQLEENYSESEENDNFKKEGELIVETEQKNILDNDDRVIEIALETASIANAPKQASKTVVAQAKPLIEAEDNNLSKITEIDLLLPVSDSLANEMIPEIVDDAMEVTNHKGADLLPSSSSFLEDDITTQDEPFRAKENNIAPKPMPQVSQTNHQEREETELKKRKATHQIKIYFDQSGCEQEKLVSGKLLNAHPSRIHSTESSTHCASFQQPHHLFSTNDMHLRTDAVGRFETEEKLGSCQPQHCLQSQKNKPSSSQGRCRRNYDWGWVTNNPQNSEFTHSALSEEPEQVVHVNRFNVCNGNTYTHRCASHLTSRCHHQVDPKHFVTVEECNLSHCTRHSQRSLNFCETSSSSHCTNKELQRLDQASSVSDTHECPNHPCLSESLRHTTISFTILDENCFTRVLNIPGISQEERSCTHHKAKPQSNCYSHTDIVGHSTVDKESRTPRACKRHLEDTKCFEVFQDSFECHENCFSNCDPSRQFQREKTTMAPTVVLLPNLQSIGAAVPSSHQSCCCRRTSEIRQPCKTNSRYTVTKPVLTSYDRTFRGEKFPGHFQLSSKAYAKLIAYCHSKKLLTGLPYDNNQASHSRNFFNSFESPLQRKPTHALNEYFELGQHFKSQFVYENQAAIDLCRLAQVFETVEECPWYWGELSGQEAQKLLNGTPVGTFLLRASSERRYLFSLTMMTRQGPTSIRIVYENGIFRFDSDRDEETDNARRFSALNTIRKSRRHQHCVIKMILHHTEYLTKDNKSVKYLNTNSLPNACSEQTSSNAAASASGEINTEASVDTSHDNNAQFRCSWMGRDGRRGEIQVLLAHPHQKKNRTLQELCRTAINKNLNSWKNLKDVEQLPLPVQLKEYIKKYPYPV